MVAFPSDWPHGHGVDIVSAMPPELGARFRWFERLAPQPTFAAIVERVLATDPDFKVHRVGDCVRAVTREGEYAAWTAIEGRRQGAEAIRFVGAVFLDHFASALDCIAILPHHFAQLRALSFELLRAANYQLSSRPRPFYYAPPPGWQALPSGPTATWYPPDFPRNLSTIAIPHAVRIEATPEAAVHRAFAEAGGGLTVESSTREEITSDAGHVGTCLMLRGYRAGRAEPIARELAMFVVGGRTYLLRLETGMLDALPALREQLRAVAGSFRPLPSADEARLGHAFAPPSTDFDHWAT